MDLDAVHEINSFGDQAMMPVHTIMDESTPYVAAYSYDELFPSLPENEVKPETPVVDLGQWTQKMKLRSTVITQVYRVPVEERKFKGVNTERFGEQGEQAKICADIMQKTGAHIEISSSKDQSLTILVTGKEEAVLKARRQIVKELQTQATSTVSIPKDHHRYILGKQGKKLADLELSTATKITVPRPDKHSDLIEVTGTSEGIQRAIHEIQEISDEQGKLAFERLPVPKIYHPFIVGPFNENLKILQQNGARVNIPPPSVFKDELTVAGEKDAVAETVLKIKEIWDRALKYQSVSVEVPKNQHRYIIGPRGHTIQEILHSTGVSVEMPLQDVPSDTITLRGEQAKLGHALTEVYSKANSVKTELLDVPSWLHKYVIGKKGANIKHTTQDLPKVQVDFIDEQIKVEGPTEEVAEAVQKLRDVVEKFKKEFAYEEIRVNPSFHRHIIGKNGANINKLKEDTKTLINIPSDGDGDIVRIEGPPEGVAEVKRILHEMVFKMENETTKELNIDQRFHRLIIGTKGESIKEIRDKFNQINITFPTQGFKSDKVIIRGSKLDVEKCYKHLKEKCEKLELENFTVDVPIYKQHHKFIIGKGGANIKKIRDETNTKIDLPAEGADSEVITIRGRKEDVVRAKEMILATQNELDNITTQEIMIPASVHNSLIGAKGRKIRSITEECGNVTIKFPNSGTGSDKVSIRGPKEDVLKAKKLLLELSHEKQSVGYTEEIKCKPNLHRYLIGKNGVNIKKVRDETGARIVFPYESDEDNDTITIIGRKEEVKAARQKLESLIVELNNTGELKINIDPKHHRHFVAKRAEVLRQIADEFDGVTVSFPKMNSNSSEVTLKGLKGSLEGAKQRLLDIVDELEAQVEVTLEIPQEHHRTMLGKGGLKVKYLQNQFRVAIKFPEIERNGANGGGVADQENGIVVNGDCHPENPENNYRNIITIKGRQEDCDAAKQALIDHVPVTAEVEVPYDFHKFIIGQKGKDVRSMMDTYDVSIIIPPQNEHNDVIQIKGAPANVEDAKVALKERIDVLEHDRQDRILKSYQTTVEVDPEHHPKLIGRRGAVISEIRKDFNVNINVPGRDGGSERIITITGYEKDAEAAKEAILKFIKDQENMVKEDVKIDSRILSRIIGKRGANVNRIMNQFKVDIRFPKSTDPDPDLVVIQGAEEDVLDAKDHLLNLEEEYMQDWNERDYLRQYTQPPSRNGTHDPDGTFDDKGFVVKGAPWDRKKGLAPDTTNTQEFPSFGSASAPPPPSKPVAWGPSRR